MREAAQEVLNRYLEAELNKAFVLPDPSELSRQRTSFLGKFGPEQIQKMSGTELLREIPHNATNEQPMDYWLEFKNDNEFNYRLFGSISGGSAAKFGAWQEKKTGNWRAKKPGTRSIHTISEDDAHSIVEERRIEMLAAVDVVREFQPKGRHPDELQAAIEGAAPRWHASAWLHKYLHINFPEIITWSATLGFSEAELYSVGQPVKGSGIYAYDVQIVRFWDTLPALQSLPPQLRYRAGKGLAPRDHWCLGLSGEVSAWKEMLAHDHISLGPRKVGNLGEVFALTKKRDVRKAVETAFADAGQTISADRVRSLVSLGFSLKEGSIVALLSDASTVVAVGQISGGYRFVPGDDRPHQVPVRWLHHQSFELSSPLELSRNFQQLPPTEAVVADIEASLLVNGIGVWPNFGAVIGTATAAQSLPSLPVTAGPGAADALPAPLEPMEGITRRVVEMLDRKRQVILYGPPGTGKTYHAERIALELVARHNFNCLPAQLSDRQRDAAHGRKGQDPFINTCTFHPMYSYEDFIEGYRPDGEGSFRLEPGIFKQMVTIAQAQPTKKFVLIIDEINRGNIPKIFGELITLIERSKRGTTHTRLPLSGDRFTVPSNLYLVGTMNTADRSILLLDTALRRRFAFRELMPEPELLATGSVGDVALSTWLRALNRRIVENLGRDGRNLQVGHAYFMPGGKPAATMDRIKEIVRDDLWPLLQEYCYEDSRKLASILAASKGGIYDEDAANLRFNLFEPGREDELAQALIAIVTPEDKKRDADIEAADQAEHDGDEADGDGGDAE